MFFQFPPGGTERTISMSRSLSEEQTWLYRKPGPFKAVESSTVENSIQFN
jgi:hypothetical protein